jgi:molybdate transport system substrate-binding protein
MNWRLTSLPILVLMALHASVSPARAEEALVAVASNFSATMARLESDFEQRTGHELTVATGSTGKLYAQIRHGAPYDILLAADTARPARLDAEGHVAPDGRFVYAVGRLALWSADPDWQIDGPAVLRDANYRHLAIANPALAPYGAAAAEVIAGLSLSDDLSRKIVMGENISQAYLLVATGNAELGFVAASQLAGRGGDETEDPTGQYWLVPENLHAPLHQEGVLLANSAENIAAQDFLTYLRGPEAAEIILQSGYQLEF